LSRRKVVQWGLAYAAGGWVLLQVLGFAADAFAWPSATKQVAMLLLLVGLPIVLVLAWYHGDRGEQRVTGVELALLVVLVLVGAGILWRYERALPSQAAASNAQPPAGDGESSLAIDKSVAVLPFTNLGHTADDLEFADGLHDDLLTQLAKIGQLKVISRTSMLEYRDTTKRIPQIARELGVAAVLEGAVQRSGQRIRLNVQLIKAATDEHLWAETYDRELSAENIFAIQSELASSIASALKASLSPEEKASVGRVLTTNLEALEGYRRAQVVLQRALPADNERNNADIDHVLELDPSFAAAWALKARIAMSMYWDQGFDVQNREAARLAIAKGRALDPDLPELDLAEAYYFYQGFRDYDKALALVERAERARPGSAELAALHGFILRRMGRAEDSLAHFRRARELDPRNVGVLQELPDTYLLLGRYAEADAEADRLIGIEPDFVGLKRIKALILIEYHGDLSGAEPFAALATDDPWVGWWVANALGKYEAALAFAGSGHQERSNSGRYPPELLRALTLRYAGRRDEAMPVFDRSIAGLEAALRQRPNDIYALRALCLARGGRGQREQAISTCRRALESVPDAMVAADTIIDVSAGQALGGAVDQALATLESGLSMVLCPGPGLFESDPAFRDLRDDPRFKALMQRFRERPPR
jgi:TolB-like protein/Flp pilus assembly protein TadD